jgi:hypothetical protein
VKQNKKEMKEVRIKAKKEICPLLSEGLSDEYDGFSLALVELRFNVMLELNILKLHLILRVVECHQ